MALLATGLLLVAFSLRDLADADLGYHLKGGEWILANLRFPATDVYTYTRSSASYIDLHWLYQLLLYSTYRIGGYVSLSLLNVVLLGTVFGIVTTRMFEALAPMCVVVPLLLVGILASEVRFHVRPEIVTWILMSCMIWVLDRRCRGRLDRLWLLPVIQLVWTNAEGLFGIGWGLMGAYLLSDLVHSKKIDRPLWGYAALAVLACFINPYFWRGALLPFTYLATLDAGNPFKQGIAEFRSPWTMAGRFTSPSLGIWAYQAYSAWLALSVLTTFRKRKVHEFVILGAFFYLSATALRNIPLFLIATLPIAARCWVDAEGGWLSRGLNRGLSTSTTAWACVIIVVILGARTVTSAHYVDEGRLDRFGVGLDGETQPVGAADFLVANHLDGRILNQMNTGGWLDWRRPGQVFLDGRTEVMGEELFVESMDALRPGGLAGLIARYQPAILFFTPTTARQWMLDLNDMPDWRPVFLDEGGSVFVRRDYAPALPLLDERRLLAERGAAGRSNEAALWLRAPAPAAWQVLLRSVYRPAVHPNGLQAMALFFQYRNEPAVSEPLFLECIRQSGGMYSDFYFNLGLMYYGAGEREKARSSLSRVLADDPGNVGALRILERLSSN